MWIRSDNQWINMNHITHFTIQYVYDDYSSDQNKVYAHLTFEMTKLTPDHRAYGGPPPTQYTTPYEILVFSGTIEECQQYVTEKTLLQQAYHWLTHLAAGLLGGLVIWLIQR